MERFLARHQGRIIGTLSGFDRVLFRGTLRSISYVSGLEIFLSSQHILHKQFGEFAQKLSERVIADAKAMAERQDRPYLYIQSSRISKEDTAREIMATDRIKKGLICVLACVEPCQSFEIRRNAQTKLLDLVSKERKCLHLYFYYVDPQFGLMHVRLQTWLPFTIQVCINGREWLARQMERARIAYTRKENCFTFIEDFPKAQKIMDKLTNRKWHRVLDKFARRLNPLIDPKAGLNIKGYYWSVRQGEYATDVVLEDAQALTAIYPSLVQHAITQFGSNEVMRFLQRRTNTQFNGEASTYLERRTEGIRVKHWVEENSIKMYDKQGSVLRIETTINNPRRFKVRRKATRKGESVIAWLPMRKGIADISRRVQLCHAANLRYLNALSVVGLPTPSRRLLDSVSKPVQIEGRRFRPLNPIRLAEAEIFRPIMLGENLLQGFRNKDLRMHLKTPEPNDPLERRKHSGQISRKLALLKAHKLIYKVPRTNYYRITKKGEAVMATALKFRETDLALLAT